MAVRFIEAGANTKDCPWYSSVPLWKKSIQPCLHQAQKKGQGPEILFYWFSPCSLCSQLRFGWHCIAVTQAHAKSLCLAPALGVHIGAGPSWLLWRENTRVHECTNEHVLLSEWMSEQERKLPLLG